MKFSVSLRTEKKLCVFVFSLEFRTADCQQKTIEAFNRLPDEFTVDDAKRCFSLTNDAVARVKINRLMKDHFVEKAGDFVENGTTKAVFKKTGKVMR